MQDLALPSLAALAALAAGNAAPPAQEVVLAWEPDSGSTHALAFETERALDGGELVVVMNDAEVPRMYLPELNLEESEHRLLHLVETHVLDGGEHTCTRRYDEIAWRNAGAMEMTMAEETESFPWEVDAASPFVGRTLRFTARDGEDHEVSVADDRVGALELSEELPADLSLRQLLPETPVAVGDGWTVDGETLALLFDPVGDVGWDLPEEAGPYMQPEIQSRAFEGELELRLESVTDGLASCAVSGELVRVTVAPGDLTQVPVVDGTATDTTEETWEAEGSLVWSLEHGRLHELRLQGELRCETDTVRDPDQPGSTYESTFSVDGTYAITVSCAEETGTVEATAAR